MERDKLYIYVVKNIHSPKIFVAAGVYTVYDNDSLKRRTEKVRTVSFRIKDGERTVDCFLVLVWRGRFIVDFV